MFIERPGWKCFEMVPSVFLGREVTSARPAGFGRSQVVLHLCSWSLAIRTFLNGFKPVFAFCFLLENMMDWILKQLEDTHRYTDI